jgi:outer membrane lipopolysaccharide assembly protein LptE/RlpB
VGSLRAESAGRAAASMLQRLLWLLLLGSLVGCGFQLRRDLALPPALATLRIEIADPYSPLGRGLEQALRRAGATLVESGDAAVLRVPAVRRAQVPLAVGITGRVQEYALQYVVEIELVDRSGQVLMPRQAIELERAFAFDTAEALGTPAEQELVQAELERDMVAAILQRIDAALRRG